MRAVRPAIYAASLADYNNGLLHGAWLDATLPPQELERQVADMLAASPTTRRTGEVAEEWAIHDTEGFVGIRIGPHEALDDVHGYAVGLWP